MQGLLSKYKPYIIVVLVSVILTYGMIYILTPKPKMPADYKSTIDSLVRLNTELQIHQLKIDSTIDEYEEKVDIVDGKISKVKKEVNAIDKQYDSISKKVNDYSELQVDSFLVNRYK
jgi:hypothetical protein